MSKAELSVMWGVCYLLIGLLLALYVLVDMPKRTVGNRVSAIGVAIVEDKFRITHPTRALLIVTFIAIGWFPIFVWILIID